MRNRAARALSITLTLALAGASTALAGAWGGRTYEGGVASSGVRSEGHHTVRLHAGGSIILRVSGNGRSVTVRFSSPYPVLYCNTTKTLRVQSTRAAQISGSGNFRASIAERFSVGPGLPPIVQVVSGHFSGGNVSGSIQTNAAECSGSTGFYARAR